MFQIPSFSLYAISDMLYPPGSFFFTTDPNFEPGAVFSGTWEKISENLALRQAGQTHEIGSQFGEAEHVLSTQELPAHDHQSINGRSPMYDASTHTKWGSPIQNNSSQYTAGVGSLSFRTGLSGGGAGHNNIGPSLAVNIWHRIN